MSNTVYGWGSGELEDQFFKDIQAKTSNDWFHAPHNVTNLITWIKDHAPRLNNNINRIIISGTLTNGRVTWNRIIGELPKHFTGSWIELLKSIKWINYLKP